MAGKIDAHQHFWNPATMDYSWLTPALGPIYRTFEPTELKPQLDEAGISGTVVVQAANSFEDTDSMLRLADAYPWIQAVIGWAPLLEPANAAATLDRYLRHPKFRGIRHLIHDEPDPDWVVQSPVFEGLREVERRGLIFEVVAVFPNHLRHVPRLAAAFPNLTLVIDHLAKPPISAGHFEPWASQLAEAARFSNVHAKISGLNTAADPSGWSAADLKPYIDHAIACFGADRLMFGSDWPVCLLADDYATVWRETNLALEGRSSAEIDAILGGTATRVYGIDGV